MPLQPQIVPISLTQGLDAKSADRAVVTGKLLRAENIRFDKPGEMRKRPGHRKLATAPAGNLLAAHKGQLVVGTGSEAYSLASSGLVDKGVLEAIGLSTLPAARNAYQQQTPDCAVHPLGISVFTYESIEVGVTVPRYTIIDTATGQPIVSGVPIGTAATKPKPMVVGNYVAILYFEADPSLTLQFVAIPATDPLSPRAPATLAANPHSSQVYDAARVGERVVVTYLNSGGANKITLKSLSPALAVSADVVPTTAEDYSGAVGIFGDASGNVWVAYYSGSAVKVFAYNYGLTTRILDFTELDASPGTVRNITGVGAATATVFYEVSAAETYNHVVKVAEVSMLGELVGPDVFLRSAGLASKPFVAAGRVHVLVAHESALQPTYFLAALRSNALGPAIIPISAVLTSPDGTRWSVTTDDSGALVTGIDTSGATPGALVLVSPDGSRWSVTVANDGALTTTEV